MTPTGGAGLGVTTWGDIKGDLRPGAVLEATVMDPVTPEEEAKHLIALLSGDAGKVLGTVERQMEILMSRAQTLLSLAGLTITVTGFSGASIARSGTLAALLLVMGLVTVLVGAALAMGGILRVRWTTQMRAASLEESVVFAIRARNQKTAAFAKALMLTIVGLALYVGSVAVLLLKNLPG